MMRLRSGLSLIIAVETRAVSLFGMLFSFEK